MAITIIHHARKVASASGDLSCDPFDSGAGGGANLLVFGACFYQSTSPTISGGVDSKGNTYTALTVRQNFDAGARLWYSQTSPTVGSSHTLTLTGGEAKSIGTIAVSGAHATAPYNSQEVGPGTYTTSGQPGSLTPTEDNCMLVLVTNFYSANNGSINSGFTGLFTNQGAEGYSIGMSYKIQTTAGEENPTVSWTGNVVAAQSMAVFKAAAVVSNPTYTGFRPSYLKKRKRVYYR